MPKGFDDRKPEPLNDGRENDAAARLIAILKFGIRYAMKNKKLSVSGCMVL